MAKRRDTLTFMTLRHTITITAVGLGLALQAPAQALKDAPLPPTRVGLPQLGLTADEALSPAQEKALGRVIWRDLRSEPTVLTDTLITDYLQQLIRKLSRQLDLPEAITLRSFAVSDPQLNAFAMPSGLMGINTGLILSVAREGELAAVMAHEIGHVSQRHFARGLASKKGDQWIALAGFAAALIAARNNSAQSGPLVEGALAGSQALAATRQLSFSRDMEREADAVGFALMRDAQYEGADMVRMLRRLGAASSFSDAGSGAGSGYAKSHPGTTERMANIEGRLRVGSVTSSSTQAANIDFLLVQARVRALLAKSPDQIDEAQSYFSAELDNAMKQKNNSNISQVIAAHYGLCQLAMQRKQWLNAQLHWTRLAPHTARHPWLVALGFELDRAMAKPSLALSPASPATAISMLENTLAAVPSSTSAAVHIVQTALSSDETLTASQLQTAQSILKAWLDTHPNDDGAWEALSKSYTRLQQPAFAVWAQAEQTAAMGVWASSINLLSDALRSGETTVPVAQQNQWRERLRDIRQIARDEKALLEKFK
jgi:predicted Zn-dependent protease